MILAFAFRGEKHQRQVGDFTPSIVDRERSNLSFLNPTDSSTEAGIGFRYLILIASFLQRLKLLK